VNVWVVYVSDFGDPDTVVGVYSTEEEARASIADHARLHEEAWHRGEGPRYFSTDYAVAGPFEVGASWSPYLKAPT
jgi:hypothetical protein